MFKFKSFILQLLVNWCRQYVNRVNEMKKSGTSGTSDIVHFLFIPAAVVKGGLLVKGYLWRLFYRVNTGFSIYSDVTMFHHHICRLAILIAIKRCILGP